MSEVYFLLGAGILITVFYDFTNGFHDEGPTWAPNGRVLMFTREAPGGRSAQIYSVDVTGRNERRVMTPGDASDPAWSPLIQ